jgi:hypothetical protein
MISVVQVRSDLGTRGAPVNVQHLIGTSAIYATRLYRPDSFGKCLTVNTLTFLTINFLNSVVITGAAVKRFAKPQVPLKQRILGNSSLSNSKFYLVCNLSVMP